MYTIGLDTAHRFLIIALLKDEKLVDGIQMECLKHQSEFLTVELDKMLSRNNLEVSDIDNWVITRGPGSYTGVRIAMTMAKVIGSLMNKNVYTLSTLQLYAGRKDCYVIMDARAKRVYVGKYSDGQPVLEDGIMSNDQMAKLIEQGEMVIGDLHLFGEEDCYGSILENFAALKPFWKKVENIDILTPSYLKSNEEYMK